jgi:chromosome segregation ATPase
LKSTEILLILFIIAEDKLEEHEKRLKELESKISGLSGGGADMDSVNKLLKDFAKKSDMEDLKKRLEKCEKKAKKAKDGLKKQEKKMKKWKPKWKQMEKDIEELKGLLKDKVDCNIFDEEMEKIKNLIN